MFQERKCACCGKILIRRSFGSYIYKKDRNTYCGWNCYRKGERKASTVVNPCVCCGREVPEGRQVCLKCEELARKKKCRNMSR